MPRTAAEDTGLSGETKAKRVVNRGARGPQPVFVFVKADATTGKLVITKSFRNPAKLAQYFPTAQDEGSQFLVTTPE
jgi:hypothetical protein